MLYNKLIIPFAVGDTGIKLLGVPPIPMKTSETAGELISTATVDLLDQWECKDSVAAMGFDTTSKNSGRFHT